MKTCEIMLCKTEQILLVISTKFFKIINKYRKSACNYYINSEFFHNIKKKIKNIDNIYNFYVSMEELSKKYILSEDIIYKILEYSFNYEFKETKIIRDFTYFFIKSNYILSNLYDYPDLLTMRGIDIDKINFKNHNFVFENMRINYKFFNKKIYKIINKIKDKLKKKYKDDKDKKDKKDKKREIYMNYIKKFYIFDRLMICKIIYLLLLLLILVYDYNRFPYRNIYCIIFTCILVIICTPYLNFEDLIFQIFFWALFGTCYFTYYQLY